MTKIFNFYLVLKVFSYSMLESLFKNCYYLESEKLIFFLRLNEKLLLTFLKRYINFSIFANKFTQN